MDTPTRTTRKTIDFTDEQVLQMDRLREDRKMTYNELVGSAVDAYLSPQPSTPAPDQVALQQRLWSLDSASQKSAERLTAIETQLDGLQGAIEQSMELLMRIAEALMQQPTVAATSTAEAPAKTPPPVVRKPGWYHASTAPRPERVSQAPALKPEPNKPSWWRKGAR